MGAAARAAPPARPRTGPASGAGAYPPGYRQRLAALHARGLAGLLASGALLALAAGAAALLARRLLPYYLLMEASFLVIWLIRKRALDRIPDAHAVFAASHAPLKAFARFRQSMDVISHDSGSYDMIGRWFDYAPIHEIRRQNVRDLLAYGFGYRPAAEFDAAGEPEVPDQLLAEIESVWGNPYAEGHNGDLKYMAHLHEPLRAVFKPLAWYLFAEGLAGVKHAVLIAAGFRCERKSGFNYYTLRLPAADRAPGAAGGAAAAAAAAAASAHAAAPPLMFCHGVGLGLLPYLQFALKLAALGRPLVAVEWPHLAMRWTHFIPTVDECTDVLVDILDTYSIPKAAFVGHSFGTFFMSRLQRTRPERVACMAFLDPVCMCMWSGHLIRAFVYKPHVLASGAITWKISRDIHTAAAVARNFFWSEYNLWPDAFPERTLVVLSGKDDLVPVRHVSSMVRHETNARMMISPGDKHAGFLFDLKWQAEVVAGVWDLVDGSEVGAIGGGDLTGKAAAAEAAALRAATPPSAFAAGAGECGAAAGANGGAGSGSAELSRSSSGELSASGSSPAAAAGAAPASKRGAASGGRRGRRGSRFLAHGHSDSAFSLSFSASLGSFDALVASGSGGVGVGPDAAPDAMPGGGRDAAARGGSPAGKARAARGAGRARGGGDAGFAMP